MDEDPEESPVLHDRDLKRVAAVLISIALRLTEEAEGDDS